MSSQSAKHSPQVSILMAVYNCQAYVAEAIESIRNQTLSDLELIIIDDGSTDDSWQIVKSYSHIDSRIKTIRNQKNAGKVVALNRGLLISQGHYIAWQDADDYSAPERLADQVSYLEKHPKIGAVASAVQMIDEEGNPIKVAFNECFKHEEIYRELTDRMVIHCTTLLARRKCMEDCGFLFDEVFVLSMDYDLALRLSEVTRINNLSKPHYYYRQHQNSLTSTRRFRQMYNHALALEHAIYRRFGPEPAVKQFGNVGRDYLRAAIIGFKSNRSMEAENALQRSIQINPAILRRRQPVETIVEKYTPNDSTNSALTFTDSLFSEFLPHNRNLARIRSRLISRLHMAEVFRGVELNEPERIAEHLWSGIRHDPSWLLNRGVVSLALKDVLGLKL